MEHVPDPGLIKKKVQGRGLECEGILINIRGRRSLHIFTGVGIEVDQYAYY